MSGCVCIYEGAVLTIEGQGVRPYENTSHRSTPKLHTSLLTVNFYRQKHNHCSELLYNQQVHTLHVYIYKQATKLRMFDKPSHIITIFQGLVRQQNDGTGVGSNESVQVHISDTIIMLNDESLLFILELGPLHNYNTCMSVHSRSL